MNLEDLRLFAAVAQAGSFTGAARALAVPKGTLSRRVAAFERDLGVPLLHRSTRRLALSEAGERLVARAVPLLEDLDAAAEEVQSLQREPRGSLRLQVPLAFLADDVASLIAEFCARYPRVSVECVQVPGAAVDPQGFDLTLLVHESALPASDLIVRPLMSLRQGIFAAPGSASVALSFAELERRPVVRALEESAWLFRTAEGLRAVPVAGPLQFDSPVMRLRAAERGAGLLKAPVLLAEPAVRAGRLAAVRLPHEPVALSVAMLYRSRSMPAKVRAFVDHLQSAPMLRAARPSR